MISDLELQAAANRHSTWTSNLRGTITSHSRHKQDKAHKVTWPRWVDGQHASKTQSLQLSSRANQDHQRRSESRCVYMPGYQGSNTVCKTHEILWPTPTPSGTSSPLSTTSGALKTLQKQPRMQNPKSSSHAATCDQSSGT